MRGVERAVLDLSRSRVPVLITGERGTGKRSLARRIHDESEDAGLPLVMADAHGLSADALAELLSAERGSLYLHEVAELSSGLQSRLLQTLRGNGESSAHGPRLFASSSRDLSSAVKSGRFREDLYYRLNAVALSVPPLRHRREDIPALTQMFAERYSKQLGRGIPHLQNGFISFAMKHGWPGNVSELEDAVRMAVAIGDERMALAALRETSNAKKKYAAPESLKEAARDASRAAERELILKTLSRTRWNRKLAARELKISYRALLYKVKQIGIEDGFDGGETETPWPTGE